jgi:Fungal fucose-specific lectin
MQPATTTTITSCRRSPTGDQTAYYVGSDQRLYILVQGTGPTSQYVTEDLIAHWQSEAGISIPQPRTGTGPRGDGPISSNAFDTEGTSYLTYIDQQNHIQALCWPIIVADQFYVPPGGTLASAMYPDLTVRTGAPPALAGSPIASYAWESQQPLQASQHVIYIGEDGNVWELYYQAEEYDHTRGGHLWHSNNLSERTGYTGALAPKVGSPLVATMFQAQESEHIMYIASDNTIRELWFYNGAWGGNNLTEATGAILPEQNTSLCTFSGDFNNTLHVIFIGTDHLVHELWWADGGWQHDHTISSNPSAPNSDLVGYSCEFDQTHHVIYVDQKANIQELYRTGDEWGNTTLSYANGAAPIGNSSTPLSGNSDEVYQSQHIYYLDRSNRILEFYRYANDWHVNVLAS